MKRMLALVLALMALLGLAAHAESKASIIRLDDLSLAYVGGSNARSVQFDGASLTLAVGDSDGDATVQATFDNGEGQVVDAVAQISGRELLFTMGGITGIYAVDLENFADEGNSGEAIAKGLSEALSLAGAHMDMVLYAITREDADGMRSVEVPLPMPQLISASEGLLTVADGAEARDMDLNGLRERVENIGDDAMLSLRYDPSTGAIELSAIHDGRGMRLSGVMTLTFEPMTFIDVTAEEEKYDLMNLSPQTLEQLQDELGMIFTKFTDYAGGTGLDEIMP